jgi:NADH:ubiquinone oxidoreductase subunit D
MEVLPPKRFVAALCERRILGSVDIVMGEVDR